MFNLEDFKNFADFHNKVEKEFDEVVRTSNFNEILIKKIGNKVESKVDGDLVGISIALAHLITEISKEAGIPNEATLAGITMFTRMLKG